MFKVLGVDHIGVAVKDLEEGKNFWSDVIGIACTNQETVAEQKSRRPSIRRRTAARLSCSSARRRTAPSRSTLRRTARGIQHVALRVDNIENAIADLMAKGVRMIDEKPRIGAGGAKIAFLHPKSTKGVLLEICEHEDR